MVILLSYCRTFFLMVLEMSFNVILPLWHKPKITLQGNLFLFQIRNSYKQIKGWSLSAFISSR